MSFAYDEHRGPALLRRRPAPIALLLLALAAAGLPASPAVPRAGARASAGASADAGASSGASADAGASTGSAGAEAGVDVSSLPGPARRALFRARGFLDDNQPERAIEVLESYLRESGSERPPILRSYLAESFARVGRTEEALAEYRGLAQVEPTDAQTWLRIGEISYGLGRYADAAEAFLAGERLLPPGMGRAAAQARHYAAVSHVLGGEADRALPLLEDLVSGRHGPPEFEWHRTLIAALQQGRRAAQCEAALGRLLEQFGEEPRAWQLAAQHAAEQGDYRRAAGALTLAGYLRPLSAREQVQLGDLYLAAGVPAEAARWYEQALGDSAAMDVTSRLASAHLAAHSSAAAALVLERALQSNPSDRLWLMMGEIRYAQGDYAAAYQALEASARLSPGSARVQLLLGYCAAELGRIDDARRHLAAAAADSLEGSRARDLLRRLAEPQ